MSRNNPKNNAYRLLRISRDIKSTEIMKALGITRAYVSAIENGKREPSLDKINAYARVLRVDVNTIFATREICRQDLPFEILLERVLTKVVEYDRRTKHDA